MNCIKKASFAVMKIYFLLCVFDCSDATDPRECCQVTMDETCNTTCIEVLSKVTSGNLAGSGLEALSTACPETYSNFLSCINSSNESSNVTATREVTTIDQPPYLACCDLSPNEDCTGACYETIQAPNFTISDIPLLIPSCGPPLADPIWACLITATAPPRTPTSSPESCPIPEQPSNMDWTSVQCCYKAVADKCRDSCLDYYTLRLLPDSFDVIQLDCVHRPNEYALSTCLADVSSPCSLGCSGLQFCENFNNRPSQFFRKCDTGADRRAKTRYHEWSAAGQLFHPRVEVFINNIEECLPEVWKALACVTHLEPCDSTTHATQICRSDCINLLTQCTNSSMHAVSICDTIAPASSEERCISLGEFLQPSLLGSDPISRIENIIENPCDPNPCSEGFFCEINRNCDSDCTPYKCQPGCVVDPNSGTVLPRSSGIRVPLLSNDPCRCHGYVNCTTATEYFSAVSRGSFSDDTPSGPGPVVNVQCETESSCITLNGSSYDHGSLFWLNCNFCACSYGRITCTNHTCLGNETSLVNCDCTNEYDPVCTRDGKTITNICQAQCFGYTPGDYHLGDCGSLNTCSTSGSFCGSNSRCIPYRHSCLSVNTTQCLQYKCESLATEACLKQTTPVCDIANIQHNTLCSFLRSPRREFNYFGYCKPECGDRDSPVCGVNGETFTSECHARNAHTLVDYYGSCRSTPGSGYNEDSCDKVNCPTLAHSGCLSVTPRGACCPLCGTVITLLMDKNLLHKNLQYLSESSITSTDVILRLQNYISYAQCELFGHVEVDDSLTMIVVPKKTSVIQQLLVVDVCHQEAVKLAALINIQIPMLSFDPYLSHFIGAHVAENFREEVIPVTVTHTVTVNSCIKYVPNIIIITFAICLHILF